METKLKYTLLERKGNVMTLWLNRPEKRNAFNTDFIEQLIQSIKEVERDGSIRFLMIRGKGPLFSAGADLEWMLRSSELAFEDNFNESRELAEVFSTLYHLAIPTLVVTHGKVFGGALGLMASADFAWAEQNTSFCFSEVKVGLSPSTIIPYIVNKTGMANTKELVYSAQVFDDQKAHKIGLVDRILPSDKLEKELDRFVSSVTANAAGAIAESKKMIQLVTPVFIDEKMIVNTAASIAKRRITEEAKEGITAFFEKRKPNWQIS